MGFLQPTDDLQTAIDASMPGEVLRLSAGDHPLNGALRFRRGIRLVGAGAAQTRITRRRTPHAHLAEAHVPAGEELVIEDLAIAWSDDGEDRQGVYLFQSDVLVVTGGRVALRHCRLAGSEREQARSNDMYGGSGLRLAGDAEVRAEGCEITAHGGHGVTVGDRAVLALLNGWVSGNRGIGLLAEGKVAVEAHTTAFLDNGKGGVAAFGETGLTLVNTVVQANGRVGVRLDTTGAARMEACTIEQNRGPGVEVATGTLTLTGGAIRGNSGDGLAVAAGCRVAATNLVIAENRGFGATEGPGASLDFSHTALYDNARGGIARA